MLVFNISAHRLNTMPEPVAAGKWQECNLERLAADLDAGTGQTGRAGIRSVPDAWAQALLTLDALADEMHMLRDDLRGQWRALIATIALAPNYEGLYTLYVLPLSPATRSKADPKAKIGKLATLLFDPALAPQTTISAGAPWADNVAAIQLTQTDGDLGGARTIGLAVPDILVAPGRSFPELRIRGVPWLEDGPVDPVTVPLSPIDAKMLQVFAKSLADAARELGKSEAPNAIRDMLRKELDQLAKECPPNDLRTKAGETTGLNWPQPLADVLNAPAEVVIDYNVSDCALQRRGDLGLTPDTSIILADPGLATPARPAHTIMLFGRHTLAAAAVRLDEIKAEAAAHGHLVLGVDDLLTANLAAVSDGSTMPGHGAAAQGHFLPMTPAMLLILSGKELATAAILRKQGPIVQAGVRLRLANGMTHELVRSYTPDRIRSVERLADFGIWPDFRSKYWKHYAVRAASNPAAQPCLVLAGSGKAISSDLSGLSGPDLSRRIRQWATLARLNPQTEQRFGASGAPTLIQFPLSDDPARATLQAWSSAPFDALFMTLFGEPAGCVVPALKDLEDPVGGAEATVAIDFGTSNTIVRWKTGGQQQGRSPPLPSRVVQPIAAKSGTEAYPDLVRATFKDFLPIDDQTMPFPTMVKERPMPFAPPGLVCIERSIFFAGAGADSAGSDGGGRPEPAGVGHLLSWIESGRIIANIKWNDTTIGRERSKEFLRQLVMMIGAELTATGVKPTAIKWRLSFPSAFKGEQPTIFKTVIGAAIRSLEGNGLTEALGAAADDKSKKIIFNSEGLAAKHALVTAISQPSSLIVLLDIGGGTTDIAIWRGGDTLWEGSFRIAARDFFTDALVRRPGILEKTGLLDSQARARLRAWSDEAGSEDKDSLAARNLIELTLGRSTFDDKFRSVIIDNYDQPDERALQYGAMTALGGLLWYAGRLIRKRVADGAWILRDEDLRAPTIALAGRGASYFKLLGPDGTGVLKPVLTMLAHAMAIDDGAPNVFFSKTPKQEVVDGLLLLDDEETAATVDSDAILGETLVTGQRWNFDTNLAAVVMPETAPAIELDETRAFIAALKASAGIDIDLARRTGDGTVQGAVIAAMKAPFRGPQSSKPKQLETPLFILGLAALIRQLVLL